MKWKGSVCILDLGYKSYQVERELLKNAGYQLRIFPGEKQDVAGKINFSKDAVGIFIRQTKINEAFLHQLPNLKAISRYGVGYDNINLNVARKYRVKVANVQGYANHSVSDHALALLFSVLRDLPGSKVRLYTSYALPAREDTFELHDKVLGIIGLGRIGSTFCLKSRALFKTTLAYDPYITDAKFRDAGAQKCSLTELLNASHVISIHCNLSEETRHLIGEFELRQMHQKPILINTARGGIVRESALQAALHADLLFGAGIDVFSIEPPPKTMDAIIDHPKVVSTGHNAWYSTNAMKNLQYKAVQNMVKMLEGEPLEDLLT